MSVPKKVLLVIAALVLGIATTWDIQMGLLDLWCGKTGLKCILFELEGIPELGPPAWKCSLCELPRQ